MSVWIRLLELEIVIEQDACSDDARFVSCKEAARAGLTADAVNKVVGSGLHGLFTRTYLTLSSEVGRTKSGTRKQGEGGSFSIELGHGSGVLPGISERYPQVGEGVRTCWLFVDEQEI